MLEFLKVILLGIVEGITEWLPISSTGHMILVEQFVKLNVTDEFLEMFRVVIQLGAILAVVVLYFPKLWPFCSPRDGWIKKEYLDPLVQGAGSRTAWQPSSDFLFVICWINCFTITRQ